jgi:molybdopterin molybdotransferase
MPHRPRTLLTAAEAARTILRAVAPLEPEDIDLALAQGRVLARPVTSPIDVPPWDNSAMDGYAVRTEDVQPDARSGEPLHQTLGVVETIPAGGFPTRAVGPGQCARIFTGAPMPEGADAVIRQEDCTPLDGDDVRIDDPRDAGRNVRKRGEDITKGSIVLETGTLLGPAQVGVLASLAYGTIAVHRRPEVAILTTGDELADVNDRDEILSGRKIGSSNTYTMRAMAREAGASVRDLGIAKDDPEALRRLLGDARTSDLLVTSGGMSVGEHDHLRTILSETGGRLEFWRLRMRPGAPVGFGMLHDLPWIGLPGNPVSTMVTFELFVRPAIRKLGGLATPFRRTVPALVGEPIKTAPPLQHFLRVVLEPTNGGLTARLTGSQGSGVLMSMVKAEGLLIVPEDRDEIDVGESMPAIVFGDARHVDEPAY